jgi:hypothetical protein
VTPGWLAPLRSAVAPPGALAGRRRHQAMPDAAFIMMLHPSPAIVP